MIAIVYGQRGAGKSIRARWLLRYEVVGSRHPTVGLVVDTLREFEDLPVIALDSVEWYRSVAKPGTQARVFVRDQDDFGELHKQLSGSLRPELPDVCLLVDEVSYWSKPAWTCSGLSQLIRYGRHLRVDLIAVCRRPAETSRELSSQADELIIQGRVVEPGDLQYLSRILPSAACEKIGALKRWEALSYSTDGSYRVLKPVKI